MTELSGSPFSGRTAWARNLQTPLRAFLRTETAGAVVLLAATVAALVWANADLASYGRAWSTELSIRLDGWEITQSLEAWINSGLMTFFFFVIGLEARREFDVGELRERRRAALPVVAGLGGMAGAVGVYLALNAGDPAAHGWGVAMSTDTAFALGLLALVGPRFPERLRSFMLTVVVVDDLLALVVIATVYTDALAARALVVALALFGLTLAARQLGLRSGLVYLIFGAAIWVALFESGVDPVVIGLVMGLLTYAYPAGREDLERATDLFRLFREQPTPELARSARVGLEAAVSPNERLQRLFHPWTSYAIVPLFALANAGIPISGDVLSRGFTSPVTLGILCGYVAGKPVGILAVSWLVTALGRGRLRPPVGWAAVAGGGAVAGIGFTISLLIAPLAFDGRQLQEAKLGILSAAVCAGLLSWLVFRTTRLLPTPLKIRALLGTTPTIVDLADPVDPGRDHLRGPAGAPVTLVEYGDLECPFCGQAESIVRALLSEFGDDLRYVWRHLPLNDVHPRAQLAAEASEAAAGQGRFWEMHDRLLENQDELRPTDLIRHAEELGLDVERFEDDLRSHAGAPRVAEDVDSADLSGVSGTPTFFVNGRRHHGAYDAGTLSREVRAARARALVGVGG